MDLVTRKWICELVSIEETSTQVQVVFIDALEIEGLLELVEARQDAPPADASPFDAAVDELPPVLLAVSDNGPQMTSCSTREFMAMCAIAQHFGRPGTPTDQAWIESLFSHSKPSGRTSTASRTPRSCAPSSRSSATTTTRSGCTPGSATSPPPTSTTAAAHGSGPPGNAGYATPAGPGSRTIESSKPKPTAGAPQMWTDSLRDICGFDSDTPQDVLAVAAAYPEWLKLGAGARNFLSYGGPPLGSLDEIDNYLFPRGIVLDRDLSTVHPFDPAKIAEHVAHSWFEYSDGDDKPRHPYDGETKPRYTGPDPLFEFLQTDKQYTWLKAPRYDGQVMEVGPLARALISYAAGKEYVKKPVDDVLKKLGADPEALFSTLGRVAARAIESQIVAGRLEGWLDELRDNMHSGDLRTADEAVWERDSWPSHAQGWGWHEAPRGALGHWIEIKDGQVANYQAVVPTTWNSGPRDADGQPGPYELALVGTPVADPKRPLEILRTVHSFDPCMACAVHVHDPRAPEGAVSVETRGWW